MTHDRIPSPDESIDWRLMGPKFRDLVIEQTNRIAELEAEVERLHDQLREPCEDAEFGMKP